jgi:CheY-like chemotaxis protein
MGSSTSPLACGTTALVVDDDGDCRELFLLLLGGMGIEATAVESAEQALARLEGGGVAIVLMDLWLPGLSGEEALREIRERPGFADLPVVAVTAHALPQELNRLRELSFDAVFSKPVDFGTFRETILRLVGAGAP